MTAVNTHLIPAPLRELESWVGDTLDPYLVSGGTPTVPASSLTFGAFATEAYIRFSTSSNQLLYVKQSAATLGPLNGGNGVYWLAITRNTYTAVTSWTRQPGTLYIWIKATTYPTEPDDALIFAQVTVTGGAISAVVSLQYLGSTAVELNAAEFYTRAELLDIKARTRLLNVRTHTQAVLDAIVTGNRPVRVLWPAGDYYLGTGASGTNFLNMLSPPAGVCMVGHGVTFVCETTTVAAADAQTQLLYLRNPRRFRMEGFHFTDLGFTSSTWLTGGFIGAYALYIVVTAPYTTSNPVRDLVFDQCTAENVNGLAYFRSGEDADSLAYAIQDVSFRSCRVKNAYYGIGTHFIKNTRIELDTIDVRRALVSYCAREGKWDVNSSWSADFLGSNAHIEIAWTNLFGPTDPALTSVDNLEVSLRVSGVEACSNLIHFYHQGNDGVSHGAMRNIRATLQYSSMTATGKNAFWATTPMNLVRFDHEYPAGTVKANTLSTWDQISLDGGFIPENGAPSFGGLALTVASIPAVPGLLEIGGGFYPPYWDLANVCNTFKLRRGHGRTTFTPVAAGSTSAGAGTYTLQSGVVEVIAGRLYFTLNLTWTAHTGTGNLLITGLPVAIVTGGLSTELSVLGAGATVPTPGADTVLIAQVQNTGINILKIVQSTGVLSALAIPAGATFYISGSYPLL